MAHSRPLAYASEMGESVRPLVPVALVRLLYGVSWGYVILDTSLKTYSVKDQPTNIMTTYAMDTAIWHTFASMALPAFTIHSIVKYSGKILQKFVNPASKIGRFGPTFFGMASIPFIIHPLDHFTDWAMDNSLRKIYGHKMPHVHKHH
jgi:fission process protein 1